MSLAHDSESPGFAYSAPKSSMTSRSTSAHSCKTSCSVCCACPYDSLIKSSRLVDFKNRTLFSFANALVIATAICVFPMPGSPLNMSDCCLSKLTMRSEEHTSVLESRFDIVFGLFLEYKKYIHE